LRVDCSFFFSSRRWHTRSKRDWSSDVCSSDLSGLASSLEVVAWVKSRRIFVHKATYRCSHGQTNVCVDVDLADTIFNGLLDLFDGYAVGFFHCATKLADLVQQFLRHARATVHDQ